ncbi:hypothetical protein DSO57_1025473 [Entomophthora muscae]|uniref:Uncharacterized protein n=1 Tax=Entomophthora muscae TaxID=34485 RepID=A0ACC2RGY8_9FUNG|nr:hypothetical protein DSO57_1025473 [Entomophthora muscae]
MTKGRGPNSKNRRRINTPTPPNSSRESLPPAVGLGLVSPRKTACPKQVKITSCFSPRSYTHENERPKNAKSRSLDKPDITSFNFKSPLLTPTRSKETSPTPDNASQRSNSASSSRSPKKKSNSPRVRRNRNNPQNPPEKVANGDKQLENSKQVPAKLEAPSFAPIVPDDCRSRGCSASESVAEGSGLIPLNPNQIPGNWANEYASLSFWDYFKAELGASEYDPDHEVKRERLTNFFKVPREFEKSIKAFKFDLLAKWIRTLFLAILMLGSLSRALV